MRGEITTKTIMYGQIESKRKRNNPTDKRDANPKAA